MTEFASILAYRAGEGWGFQAVVKSALGEKMQADKVQLVVQTSQVIKAQGSLCQLRYSYCCEFPFLYKG